MAAFFRAYMDAFSREDMDAVTEAFAFPWALITDDRGLYSCNNETDHRRLYGGVFSEIKARGWVRSEIGRLMAWALADNLGMIVADYTRYKADGSVLEIGRACYTLRRAGKSWKMVALTEVKPPFLGPGNLLR
jgi:hypothetical protein